MGLLVSKYDVGPTEEKVLAVLEAKCPSTPAEVRSFLGMVGFSARFIPNLATITEPLKQFPGRAYTLFEAVSRRNLSRN